MAESLTGEYINYSPVFPNLFVCVGEIYSTFSKELVERLPKTGELNNWIEETWDWHYVSYYITLAEVYHVVIIAVVLSVLRYFLTKPFESIPRSFGVMEHDVRKFPESAWKTILYAFLWSWAVYICFFSEKQYFFYMLNHWNDWAPGVAMPTEIYWLYMFQMGLYAHCVYACLFIDEIRKDFVMMMLHHFLTLGLLSYSYGVRFHAIGLLVLFVQDFGDLSLESSKCIHYMKTRNNVECKTTDKISTVSFAVFTVQWVIMRLYWYPTKLLYSSGFVSMQFYPSGPFYLSFNVMLTLLYLMQVYWFTFILRLLVKMALYGDGVNDTRETEEEQKAWRKALKDNKKIAEQ